jgi:pimeloyl-ACP methyl ester carboxylesterase
VPKDPHLFLQFNNSSSSWLLWVPDWRTEVQRTVPGGPEQAEADAATFFEVELPALLACTLDEDRGRRIAQPILYLVGSESGPHFDRAKQALQSTVAQTEAVVLPGLNHLLQMRNPHVVAAPIADFLARHPLWDVRTSRRGSAAPRPLAADAAMCHSAPTGPLK